jgi:hypothetical protein
MRIIKPVSEKGLCLIDIEVSKSLGDTYINTQRASAIGMIDTGAQVSAVSQRLAKQLDLDRGNDVETRGFELQGSNWTFYHLFIPELTGEVSLALHAIIHNNMESSGFDVVIGADYLRHVKFERDGLNKVFSLSIDAVH